MIVKVGLIRHEIRNFVRFRPVVYIEVAYEHSADAGYVSYTIEIDVRPASGLGDDLAYGGILSQERRVVQAGNHSAHAFCQLVISSVNSKIYRALVVGVSSTIDFRT